MNDQVEDLYLKGFMAFSSKNYSAAKAYWEQAIALNPDHEKTKRGLAELAKLRPKKRSSKEVLQQIKQLYGAKQYEEALKLCKLLVKKHPKNQDLQGLYRKIENRWKQQQAAAAGIEMEETMLAPSAQEGDLGANTQVLAVRSEEAIDREEAAEPEEDRGARVERLIQEGVGYYEVESYDQAIACWEKALALDPDNRIAKDYIQNVKSQMGDKEAPAATPAPPAGAEKGSKEDLLQAYNEGMAFFKQRQYDQAMARWDYILQRQPGHQATLQCVERTKAALEKQNQLKAKLEEARGELASGNLAAAERLATKLSIEAPELDGVEKLNEAIRERQKQINEIRGLEIEETEKTSHAESTPSDEEITRFFTPETDDGGRVAARKVAQVTVPDRSGSSRRGLYFGLAAVAALALAAAGYFYGPGLLERYQGDDADFQIAPLVRKVDWNSKQQTTLDFIQLGKSFSDAGEPLLAFYAYQRAADIADQRMAELRAPEYEGIDFEIRDELNLLGEKKRDATDLKEAELAKVIPDDYDPKDLERARAELKRDLYDDASQRLRSLLSSDYNNWDIRQLAGDVEEEWGFARLKANQLDEAMQHFRNAAALKLDYDLPRRHVEVITRFFSGKISAEDKDNWFVFFTE